MTVRYVLQSRPGMLLWCARVCQVCFCVLRQRSTPGRLGTMFVCCLGQVNRGRTVLELMKRSEHVSVRILLLQTHSHCVACAHDNPAVKSSVHLVCRTFCKLVAEAIIALCSCHNLADWLCTRADASTCCLGCRQAPLQCCGRYTSGSYGKHECNRRLAWQATCTLLN
jgi:hypothetical protein